MTATLWKQPYNYVTNGGRVTVVTMGPSQAEECLRDALAMGADEAVLLRPGLSVPIPWPLPILWPQPSAAWLLFAYLLR